MATVTLKGNAFSTVGSLPEVGSDGPSFSLVKQDLSEVSKSDYAGTKLILNIFPSIDTPTCAMSVRKFNEDASSLEGCSVLCISMDLPFAFSRFCATEGIDDVDTASGFRSSFGTDYQLEFSNGPLMGLYSRCIVILDETGKVIYTEQVPETADEPNYAAALAALA